MPFYCPQGTDVSDCSNQQTLFPFPFPASSGPTQCQFESDGECDVGNCSSNIGQTTKLTSPMLLSLFSHRSQTSAPRVPMSPTVVGCPRPPPQAGPNVAYCAYEEDGECDVRFLSPPSKKGLFTLTPPVWASLAHVGATVVPTRHGHCRLR
eukprot:COSAG02_NODE_4789_length_4976_cov_3.656551_2_plen_151_part_00